MANTVVRDNTVDQYMQDIDRYPLLTREQERALAERYRDQGNLNAAHQLVVSNLRFVVKVAHDYRGYELNLLDLIQEGNIGLMMAVKKFDPDKGYRLISYAVWWIRAYIQNCVLRSWSLVKLGTTQAQRRLFYNLRSQRELADREAGPGETASLTAMAQRLRVAEGEISSMELRLAGRDLSLDAPTRVTERITHLDLLVSPAASPESRLGELEQRHHVRGSVAAAMTSLNDKERYIATHRLMAEEPETLQEIGCRFQISRERARQIEENVLRKLRTAIVRTGEFEQAVA